MLPSGVRAAVHDRMVVREMATFKRLYVRFPFSYIIASYWGKMLAGLLAVWVVLPLMLEEFQYSTRYAQTLLALALTTFFWVLSGLTVFVEQSPTFADALQRVVASTPARSFAGAYMAMLVQWRGEEKRKAGADRGVEPPLSCKQAKVWLHTVSEWAMVATFLAAHVCGAGLWNEPPAPVAITLREFKLMQVYDFSLFGDVVLSSGGGVLADQVYDTVQLESAIAGVQRSCNAKYSSFSLNTSNVQIFGPEKDKVAASLERANKAGEIDSYIFFAYLVDGAKDTKIHGPNVRLTGKIKCHVKLRGEFELDLSLALSFENYKELRRLPADAASAPPASRSATRGGVGVGAGLVALAYLLAFVVAPMVVAPPPFVSEHLRELIDHEMELLKQS